MRSDREAKSTRVAVLLLTLILITPILVAGAKSAAILQGRFFSASAPSNGDAITWNSTANQWEPGSVGGGAPHAASHQNGGADEVATATAGANAIPKAGGGGTLATGWIPDLSSTYATAAKGVTGGDAHASRHNAGGADAMAIDAAAATGSLRTLGTASTSAAAGNDSRLSDKRAPTITSEATGDTMYFNGTNWVRLPAGTLNYVLTSGGASTAPAWAAAGSGTTFSGNVFDSTNKVLSNLRINDGTLGLFNTTWGGTMTAISGGWSLSGNMTATDFFDADLTQYRLMAVGASGQLSELAGLGTTGQILTSNGAGVLPTFQDPVGGGTIAGLTANRVPYAAGATSLIDTNGPTYTAATRRLDVGSVYATAGAGGIGDVRGATVVASDLSAYTGSVALIASGGQLASMTTQGTAGYVLTSAGAGNYPVWSAASGSTFNGDVGSTTNGYLNDSRSGQGPRVVDDSGLGIWTADGTTGVTITATGSGGTANYLRADGAWATPGGPGSFSGDVGSTTNGYLNDSRASQGIRIVDNNGVGIWNETGTQNVSVTATTANVPSSFNLYVASSPASRWDINMGAASGFGSNVEAWRFGASDTSYCSYKPNADGSSISNSNWRFNGSFTAGNIILNNVINCGAYHITASNSSYFDISNVGTGDMRYSVAAVDKKHNFLINSVTKFAVTPYGIGNTTTGQPLVLSDSEGFILSTTTGTNPVGMIALAGPTLSVTGALNVTNTITGTVVRSTVCASTAAAGAVQLAASSTTQDITIGVTMPDTSYHVNLTSVDATNGLPGSVRVTARTATTFTLTYSITSGTTDITFLCVDY